MIPFQQLTVLPTLIQEAQANPCANEISRGGGADNAFIPQDDDDRECDFTGYFDFEEEIDSEDIPPALAQPFTISGTGSGTVICQGGAPQSATLEISAQGEEDGTVTGTFGIGIQGPGTFLFPITGGTTDGNTFSLSGETSPGIHCGSEVQQFTVSGDCGTGVAISYEEPDATGTFTGSVTCTLL